MDRGKRPPQIIPAQPGYVVAVPYDDGDISRVVGIYWEPVIAWRIEQAFFKDQGRWNEYVRPITADNNVNDEHKVVLRYPGGRMVADNGIVFPDEKAVLAYFQEQGRSL